jgi:carbamoyltransferase
VLILGLTGGMDPVYSQRYASARDWLHDSAAVLLDDGEVVAAIEEERLNRIKHTNKAPVSAVRFCLNFRGVSLDDIDAFAVYTSEDVANERLLQYYLLHPELKPFLDYKSLLCQELGQALGQDINKDRFVFVHHHVAHAMSAFIPSGFERSLVYAVDASGGNGISAMLLDGQGTELKTIQVIPESKSLGYFYLNIIRYLGYQMWDEYKVMGLAPYGDPGRYRSLFKSFYELMPEGDYVIHWSKLSELFSIVPPRAKAEPVTRTHKDVAASLQEALEAIVIHVLRYYQRKTGHTKLCLAGGVAHNCTLNGKLMYSGIFDDVFVQPAAHDAGCALGAALFALYKKQPAMKRPAPPSHVYWGADVPNRSSVGELLSRWSEFVEFEESPKVIQRTAELLAKGGVVGWVQGRSEFGPRALGNRSILADPRPPENKDIINELVKKREGFRPFAPSVPEERLHEYFEVPPKKKQLPFMVFVVKVRKEKQALLGAVTHVDGTARVHSVSRETNSRFWDLINEFGNLTGVHVLLNTSFNNNVEPIVDSPEDAIICFLTTNLQHLVIGDYLVTKKNAGPGRYLSLFLSIPRYTTLSQNKAFTSNRESRVVFEIGNSYDDQFKVRVSAELFGLLIRADGKHSLDDLIKTAGLPAERERAVIDELIEMWSKRLINLNP